MKILGIIPARYGSTRFPGKPLAEIHGKPMILWVYEKAKQAGNLDELIVATDDRRILDAIKNAGGNAIMTSGNHGSGTERCREVVDKLEKKKKYFDIIVNIQGDEPFIHPGQIDIVTADFEETDFQIATLAKVIDKQKDLSNPNVVKVITAADASAIYFSRSAIPFIRSAPQENWVDRHNFLKHIGIYAYREYILKEITQLKPGRLEQAESLEQLRWLENGYSIRVKETEHDSLAIDTPEDFQNFINII